ncbi:MAG: hypothetical protein IIU06_06875 [Erysipelotrichales bacterium]|nr:hypothetical protein [Erysipelotrichales bacterium]
MIEVVENALQIAALVICSVIAVYKAVHYNSRTWALAAFFFISWVMGDIYWLVCLLFYDTTPQISIVSDLSWYASYMFLYLMLLRTSKPDPGSTKQALPWLGPLFAAGMAVFFMLKGEILNNLIYGSLMGLLLFSSINRLINRTTDRNQRFLPAMILVFCLLEYGLWISSCFWTSDTLANPYYWFDVLLTVSFLFFLPAIRKAVSA